MEKDNDTKESLIEAYKKNKLPIPSPKEIDEALERMKVMQTLKDDLLEEWRKHLDISIKEFNELDINQVYKDIDNYGIDKLLDIDTLQRVEYEALESIRPDKYIMANNKFINELAKDNIPYNQLIALPVKETKQGSILNAVSINYEDENIELQTSKRFTPYDRTVHNAVCSLFEAGNTNFTPDQVYRCMNGLDNTSTVSPQSVGAVTKSIDKSRKMYATVDYTNEAKHYKTLPNNVERLTQEDYILSAKKTTLEAGGHVIEGYKLKSKPLLYEYAQTSNQVITVPSELLRTNDKISNTTDVIVIRDFLIRRIEQMKHPRNKKMGNKILFQTIYEEIGEFDIHKKKASTIRSNINKLLTKFKDEKYILDFNFYKTGRAFLGIEIKYSEKKK